jgi:hypothetical protein
MSKVGIGRVAPKSQTSKMKEAASQPSLDQLSRKLIYGKRL